MTDRIRLHFLGTGGAVPSATRWAPALAVEREGEIILLDCGEGVQIRLQQAGLSPARIGAILLSHLHGDHLFGLPGLLTSQQLLGRTAPLTICGPVGIRRFLESLSPFGRVLDLPLTIIEWDEKETPSLTLGAFSVKALPLCHSAPCFGYRLQEPDKPGKFDAQRAEELGLPEGPLRRRLLKGETVRLGDRIVHPNEVVGPPLPGRSIIYCTDTVPCENSVSLARNGDVLVHDATFSDAYADRAEQSMHSTARQAAQIARNAGVKRLILWHLSLRVHGTENDLLQEAREEFADTLVPADLELFELPRRTP